MHWKAWKSIFYVIIWTVWQARNDIIFTDGSWNAQVIEFQVKLRVGQWIKARNSDIPYAVEVVARMFDHLQRFID